MRALGYVALSVVLVVGAVIGLYVTAGEDPEDRFVFAMVGGLFFVMGVLFYGGVTRRKLWVPVVAGLGFFLMWDQGLLTQVVAGAIGALSGLILSQARGGGGEGGGEDGGGGE